MHIAPEPPAREIIGHNKQAIIKHFDQAAPTWDSKIVRNEGIICEILDHAGIHPGVHILDVACGTGVLFPDYLQRGAASVTGIDISPEMVKIARRKFPLKNIQVLCGDVIDMQPIQLFDCIIVYNAFPHFPDPHDLIRKLSSMLKAGGTLTVAHNMSRKRLDTLHAKNAPEISTKLMCEDALSNIFSEYLQVTTKISNEHMYQVAGKKTIK